jgi:phosphomannomutase / phosphoglucomutase
MRLFGTNGIREVVGEKLTAPFVTRVAAAIAAMVPAGPPIVVGWDGRTSSRAFAAITSATLSLAGHRVIEVGLLPTPAVQYLVPRHGAQLGVILTASHNPPEFNGVKLIGSDGLEVTRAFEEGVEAGVDRAVTPAVPYSKVGEIVPDHSGVGRYVEGILGQVDSVRIAAQKFKVVLDCGNGASVATSPLLLRRLGCRVVSLNGHVDGTFPGHLSEPTPANLADLAHVVPAVGADLGIAHDGDADRAVFVDATGRYIPGEETLTLLARDAVERAHGGVVVTPVSASQAVEDAVRPLGGAVVYTRIGSPAVTHEMQERNAVFGGEENGGVIFPSHQLARDGAMTAAAVLDLLARRHCTLAEALAGIPRYTLVKEKVACPVELRGKVMERVVSSLTKESSHVVTLDGVKAYLEGGWLLLRPSGTEPLFRVFAEAKDPQGAKSLADRGLVLVHEALAALGHPPGARASAPASG